ncbi:MAG: hypothetical protein CML68_09770 [Rhodobacteraceae bacterium]|nr:hypothetical protein [Paracoccaceae bacterium]
MTATRRRVGLGAIAPAWVTRAGLRFLLVADVLIIGRLAPSELAAAGIAYSLAGTLHAVALGLMVGGLVSVAAAHARGDRTAAFRLFQDAVLFALLAGGGALLIAFSGPSLLRALGQAPDISATGGAFMRILGLGVPLHYVFVAVAYACEALGAHRAAAWLAGTAFATNAGLSALAGALVGDDATAALVIVWIGVATRAVLLVAGLHVLAHLSGWPVLSRAAWRNLSWRRGRPLRRLGTATGVSVAIEAISFSSLSVFAGWLGTTQLAAYALLNNLVSLLFSLAVAVGAVTGARISEAVGRDNRTEARAIFSQGLATALTLMALTGAAAYLGRHALAQAFIADPAVAALAVPLIWLVALLMLGDGGQTVSNTGLRALGDVWPPTLINLGCYILFMIAGGYLLAVRADRGVAGLIEATTLASFSVFALLAWRFYRRVSGLTPR